MASALVFVDDLVLDDLPAVCAKHGGVTDDRFHLRSPTRRLGPLWLAVLLGPPAWIVLIAAAWWARDSTLEGEVPLCEACYRRLVRARRSLYAAEVVTFAAAVALTDADGVGQRAGTVLTAALVAVLVVAVTFLARTWWERSAARFTVGLDGSRRWVTIRGVHPAFVSACDARYRSVSFRR